MGEGELGQLRRAEEADFVAKYGTKPGVYLGVWPLIGVNEIEVAHRLKAEMDRIRPTLPKDIDMQLVYSATVFMEDALTEITWDEFFAEFEGRELALLYDEKSLFSKIVGRDTAEKRAHGDHKAAR